MKAAKREAGGIHTGLLTFLWTVFFGTVAYMLFFSPYLLITDWQVQSGSSSTSEQIRIFLAARYSGKYYKILPKNNFFAVWPGHLSMLLAREFPLVRSAAVERVFPNRAHVDIEERATAVVWCSGGPCYLLDEQGVTHGSEKALSEDNRDHVAIITDQSGEAITLGDQLFDYDLASFIASLPEAFRTRFQMDIAPVYSAASRFADEVRFKTPVGYDVYLSTVLPLDQSLDSLALLFEKEIPKDQVGNLEYIDLRTENRIFYKMKNAEPAPPITEPAPPETKKKK